MRSPTQVGRQAARAAASAWGQHFSTIAAGLVLTPLLIRELGASRYGAWGVCLAIFGYVGLLDLGVGTAVSIEGARLRGHGDRTAFSSLIAATHSFYRRLAMIPVGVGVCLAWGATSLSSLDSAEFSQVVLLLAVAAGLNFLSISYASAAAMMGAPHVANIGRTAGVWAYAIGGTGALLSGAGLRGVAMAWASANALSAFCIIAQTDTVQVSHLHTLSDTPGATQLIRLGLPFFTNSLAWQLVFATDTIVIASTLGTEAVASYLPTFRLAEAIGYATLLPLTGLLPLMGGIAGTGDRQRLTTALRRTSIITIAMALLGGTLGVVFGSSVIRLWVGADFFAGHLALVALMTFLVVRSVTATSASALASAGHMRRVALVTLLEGVLNVLLSLSLVRPLGITGVALATLCAHLAVSAWILPLDASWTTSTVLSSWLRPAVLRALVAASPGITTALVVRIVLGPAMSVPALVGQLAACGIASMLGLWLFALDSGDRKTVCRALIPTATE